MPAREQDISELKVDPDVVTKISNAVARHVLPLFVDDHRGRPALVGSGFLVTDGHSHYLISAAHVFDFVREGQELYHYIQPKTRRKLAGQLRTTRIPLGGTRKQDRLDTGVLMLQGPGLPPYPEIDKYPLPIEALAPNALPRELKQYLLVGTPGSQTSVNRVVRRVLSKTYAFHHQSAAASVYFELGVAPETHIVLAFDRKRVHVYGKDNERFTFPDPSGMSGSPLWLLHNENDQDQAIGPVGVAIEHHRDYHAIVATDIEIALRLIRGDAPSRRLVSDDTPPVP